MSGVLAGRRAYITGGSSGIGAAIARTFAGEGARVAIGASRHAEQAQALADSLPRRDGANVVVRADLSDRQQTDRAADEAIAGLGGLDLFVHCLRFHSSGNRRRSSSMTRASGPAEPPNGGRSASASSAGVASQNSFGRQPSNWLAIEHIRSAHSPKRTSISAPGGFASARP